MSGDGSVEGEYKIYRVELRVKVPSKGPPIYTEPRKRKSKVM